MKQILLVDDEPLSLRIYREGLARRGFEVAVAEDGLAAVAVMRRRKPDLVVLDLMMPKFTGVDVLKFMRADPKLASVPVVVLSNTYMTQLAQQAVNVGVQVALLKISSSPSLLSEAILNLLQDRPLDFATSKLLAVPAPEAGTPAKPSAAPAPSPRTEPPSPAAAAADFLAKTRRDFLASAAAAHAELDKLWQDLLAARNDAERDLRLRNLYRKIHFLAATAGLAHCPNIALLSSAFEAMLFEIIHRPALFTSSAIHTAATAVKFLGELLLRNPGYGTDFSLAGQVLVVDDDAVSNRLVVAALRRAHLHARSAENARAALQMLRETRFDLLLLDIEMPEMSGLDLCVHIRALAAYRDTPIVFVTRHSDFDSRAQATLSGGNDLIGKPFFALELAVKAVTHLLRSRLADSPGAR